MRYILSLLSLFGLMACQSEAELPQIENRYDRVSIEDTSEQSKPLRGCIGNPECATRIEAMADLGILVMAGVPRGDCEWRADESGQLRPVASSDSAATRGVTPQSMTLDEWVSRGADQTQPPPNAVALINPYKYSCDFDNQTAAFEEGYGWLIKANENGNKEAANEIGSLHIDDPDLFDLAYGRSVLDPCHAAGGGLCAFNLARIESLEAEDGCGRCLRLLRIAGTRTNDKSIRFMYALAKSRTGRGDVVGRVFHDFELDSGAQSYLVEFDAMFPRLASMKTP